LLTACPSFSYTPAMRRHCGSSFKNEISAATPIDPDTLWSDSPRVPSDALGVAQLTPKSDSLPSEVDWAVRVLEAEGLAGDNSSSMAAPTVMWWAGAFYYKYSSTTVTNPDPTPIAVRPPGRVLAAGCIAQLSF
jgi:hypothetical protein